MCDPMNPVSEIGLNALCVEVADTYLVVTVLLENVEYCLDFAQVVDPST